MYGNPMRVSIEGSVVTLKPMTEADLEGMVLGMSSLKVRAWAGGIDVPTADEEREWLKRTAVSKDKYGWGIFPEGSDRAVGSTGLNHLDYRSSSCRSGIMIWDPTWWGKGIATRTHLARTLFAADWLGMKTIISEVRTPNEASLKALLRVGYAVTGRSHRNWLAEGRYYDTLLFTWVNPAHVAFLYGGDPVPADVLEACEMAQKALEQARRCVEML